MGNSLKSAVPNLQKTVFPRMVDMSDGKDVECGALEQGRETGLTNNSGKIPKAKDKNNPPNPATTNPLKQSKTPELVLLGHFPEVWR